MALPKPAEHPLLPPPQADKTVMVKLRRSSLIFGILKPFQRQVG
jgi:hypothetical protein